jgi:hypothetical protein
MTRHHRPSWTHVESVFGFVLRFTAELIRVINAIRNSR